MKIKIKQVHIVILIYIFFFFGFLFFSSKANAQELESRGVSISPIKYEFSADPGEIISEKIKVYNPTDSQFGVSVEADDFYAVGETGQVVVGDSRNERYSLKKWVRTDPEKFVLGPHKEQFVNFTIEIPENADPGGKYGSILAVMTPDVDVSQTGALIAQKVGALVLLSVSGPVQEKLNVKEIQVPGFSEYGPVNFGIRFENLGTVHLKPRGYLTIENMFGQKSADLEITQQNVIPGAVRRVETTWDKKWLFGKYSARIVGDFGEKYSAIDSPVVYFWVIPWRITLAVILLLTIIIFILYRSRKRLGTALRIIIRGK